MLDGGARVAEQRRRTVVEEQRIYIYSVVFVSITGSPASRVQALFVVKEANCFEWLVKKIMSTEFNSTFLALHFADNSVLAIAKNSTWLLRFKMTPKWAFFYDEKYLCYLRIKHLWVPDWNSPQCRWWGEVQFPRRPWRERTKQGMRHDRLHKQNLYPIVSHGSQTPQITSAKLPYVLTYRRASPPPWRL